MTLSAFDVFARILGSLVRFSRLKNSLAPGFRLPSADRRGK